MNTINIMINLLTPIWQAEADDYDILQCFVWRSRFVDYNNNLKHYFLVIVYRNWLVTLVEFGFYISSIARCNW